MTTNDNRDIDIIYLTPDGSDIVKATTELRLVFHSEFMGDHQEEWVYRYNAAGVEVARYNSRFIASIHWKGDA